MSSLDEYFSDHFSGKKKDKDLPVYTGAYERISVQADTPHLRVYVHKGAVVAVYYGDRPLPFQVEKIEPDQIVTLQSIYRKGLAGLIDRISLRVAKS